jgi:hypothetical protein
MDQDCRGERVRGVHGDEMTAAVHQLKIFKVFSNPTDIAYGDNDTTCMIMRELGIKHLTDFTTKTSGGHTFPFWNEVVRKYAPTLFK